MKIYLTRDHYAGYTLIYYGNPKFTTKTAKNGDACGSCPNRIKKLFGFMDCFVCRHENKGHINAIICQDMIPIRESISDKDYKYPPAINRVRYERLKVELPKQV